MKDHYCSKNDHDNDCDPKSKVCDHDGHKNCKKKLIFNYSLKDFQINLRRWMIQNDWTFFIDFPTTFVRPKIAQTQIHSTAYEKGHYNDFNFDGIGYG